MDGYEGDKPPPLPADSYERPTMIDLGTLEELTQGIRTDPDPEVMDPALGRSVLQSP